MKAAIYIRVSTDEQADEGYSLAEQRRLCEAYAIARGWEIVGIYADEGLSAFKDRIADRPQLERLLLDVQLRRVNAVIVHKLDRFFRRTKLLLSAVEDLEACKCVFVSVSEQIDFTTPSGRVMLANFGAFAEYYSRNLSAETAKGLRGKARAGDWVGPTPYGYDRDGKTLAPNADAPAVTRIFHLYATGTHSHRSIADSLNADGLTTCDWRTGQRGRWGRENVRCILRNPAYAGMVRCKEITAPGNHPALISREEWERCQELLKERTYSGGLVPVQGEATRKPGRLLSGIVRCAVCDKPMWVNNSKTQSYYRCAGHDHRTCDSPWVQARTVEAEALDIVRAFSLSSDWRTAVLQEAQASFATAQTSGRTIDPATIQKQLERLALVYTSGDLSKETYEAERTRLKARLREAAQPQQAQVSWQPEIAGALLDDFAQIMDLAQPEEQRALIRSFFKTVWLKPHTIHAQTPADTIKPLVLIAQRLQEGGMGCPTGFEPATS